MRNNSTLIFLLGIVVASIGITVWMARRNKTTTACYVPATASAAGRTG